MAFAARSVQTDDVVELQQLRHLGSILYRQLVGVVTSTAEHVSMERSMRGSNCDVSSGDVAVGRCRCFEVKVDASRKVKVEDFKVKDGATGLS